MNLNAEANGSPMLCAVGTTVQLGLMWACLPAAVKLLRIVASFLALPSDHLHHLPEVMRARCEREPSPRVQWPDHIGPSAVCSPIVGRQLSDLVPVGPG